MSRLTVIICASMVCLPASVTYVTSKPSSPTGGVPAGWYQKHKLTGSAKQAKADPDADGLVNLGEYRAGTNPRMRDTDRNGVTDGREDRDRDRVDNATELRAGTSPKSRDTDRDGVTDDREDPDRDGMTNREEDITGHDPRRADTDADGIVDGRENTGRVLRRAGKNVTLRRVDGTTVTATLAADSDCFAAATEDYERDAYHPISDQNGPASDETGSENDDTGMPLDVIIIGEDGQPVTDPEDEPEDDGVRLGLPARSVSADDSFTFEIPIGDDDVDLTDDGSAARLRAACMKQVRRGATINDADITSRKKITSIFVVTPSHRR